MAMRKESAAILLGVAAACGSTAAQAASFELFGMDAETQLQATYSLAARLKDPSAGIIDSPPSPEIPLPDYLKLPESINYDDGDRNFRGGALINNRMSLLGEFQLRKDDYGFLIRGDAFYDQVYRERNDNDSPDTINKTQNDVNEFSDIAMYRSGRRARILDAYLYGSWYLSDETALNLRLGRHIAAWGESLFFSGVALAQSPADATKATVPGADVKSILMPVNQISMQLALDSQWTVLGQYKLEWKETELNPVGEHFSVSDVVGPGAEFIYGIDNPLFLENLSDVNILSDDVPEAVELITRLLDLPTNPLTTPILEGLGGLLAQIDAGAPNLLLPPELLSALQPLLAGAPKYINVQRGRDLKPSDHGQWGLGLKYQLTPVTNIGLYRLRYHNTTPAPVQNYGFALLAPSPLPGVPDITTEQLGLQVPVTYNIKYFDGIDLSALSFSTSLFGANIGGELIYRDGIDVLVDVDGGLLGPVPTPTRGKVWQGLLSGLYVVGPALFWDSLTIVGETGYIHVADQEAACGPTSCSEKLTYTRDASGYAFLFLIDRKNVVSGWDLNIPVYYSGIIDGHSSFLSGLGSLMGEKDRRASIGVNLTWLQKLQVGVSVNWFLGNPHFSERPYADRDYAAFTAKYNF